MSREIKFRARRTDNGQWVYGQYFRTPLTDENSGTTPDAGWFFLCGEPRHCIVKDGVSFVIDVKTLGQYTGLKDKNEKEIYEGDIYYDEVFRSNVVIEFNNARYFSCQKDEDRKTIVDMLRPYQFGDPLASKIEAIGNIYTNPELLEGAAK